MKKLPGFIKYYSVTAMPLVSRRLLQ